MEREDLLKWYEENKSSASYLKNTQEYQEIINLTSFLDEYYDKIIFSQRVWHIKNNCFEIQTCKICGKPLPYKKQEKQYKQTCSNDCFKQYMKSDEYSEKQKSISKQSQKKIKQTCLEKYGKENFSKTEKFKQKYKETCNLKYGVDNYAKSDEFKKKVIKNKLEKYSFLIDF